MKTSRRNCRKSSIALRLVQLKQISEGALTVYNPPYPKSFCDNTKLQKHWYWVYMHNKNVQNYVGPVNFSEWRHGPVDDGMYHIIQQLINEGYVKRMAEPSPSKRVLLRLSSKGERYLQENSLPSDIDKCLNIRDDLYARITSSAEVDYIHRKLGVDLKWTNSFLKRLSYGMSNTVEHWIGKNAALELLTCLNNLDKDFYFSGTLPTISSGKVFFTKEELDHLYQQVLKTCSVSGQEMEVANLLRDYADKSGIESVMYKDMGVMFTLPGRTDREILMVGHLDTVKGLIEVRTDGKFVQGRGAVDNKGPALTSLLSMVLSKMNGCTPYFTTKLFAAFGEEYSDSRKKGVVKALNNDIFNLNKTVLGIVLESTDNNISVGHPCRIRIVYRFTGPSAHKATALNRHAWISLRDSINYDVEPLFADLADLVDGAKEGISGIENELDGVRIIAERHDDPQNTPSPNQTPTSQFLDLDIRVSRQEQWQEIRQRIDSILHHWFPQKYPYKHMCEVVPSQVIDEPTFFLDYGEVGKRMKKMLRTLEIIVGAINPDARLILNRFHTDAPYLLKKGIPTVIMGPGCENWAHVGVSNQVLSKWNERVLKIDLMKALLIYFALPLLARPDRVMGITVFKRSSEHRTFKRKKSGLHGIGPWEFS